MKEKVIFTTALCLSAMTQMMAQNITGKVMDMKGEPLAFANVVLLNRTDSAFVKGAVSGEDGSFVIDSSCNGGIIKVTSVGYKTICKDCIGENVGIIKMEEDSKMLGEVVVKSSLPKTILKNGGMTTTVAGSVLEKAGTMEHLLDRIPNISAQNGSIKVFGRGEPVIYINGRQMRDKSELDRLHSDNIKSVEVITNPGARYAASTKAVIRITTKKIQGEGFGFDAKTTGEYDEKKNFGGFSQLNMSYRKNGLELGAYAFGARQYQPDNKDLQQKTYLDKTWNQKSEIRQVGIIEAMNFRLDASYQLDANNSIGANFGFLRNPKQTCDANMATEIWQDDEQTENSDSHANFFEQKAHFQAMFTMSENLASSASTSMPTGFGRRITRTLLPKSNIRRWGWTHRARRFIALLTRNIVCWLPSWYFPILCWVVSYLWAVNIPTRIAHPSIRLCQPTSCRMMTVV